jgi:DNA-binding GntR family transcriptional regulator
MNDRTTIVAMTVGPDEVGEVFGVSRKIVRAALHAQAHDGLVQPLERHPCDELAARDTADRGPGMRLPEALHEELARIADLRTLLRMVEALVTRSSLIVALCRRQESPLCGSDAPHAMVDPLALGDLDSREPDPPRSQRQALGR